MCSCLKKKFIIKEHVKLLLTTDLLKLRQNFDAELDPYMLYATSELSKNNFDNAKLKLFELLRDCIFTNQVIENHKIVNYHIIKEYYDKLINCDNESVLETFVELFSPEHTLLKKKTDNALLSSKIKKFENT